MNHELCTDQDAITLSQDEDDESGEDFAAEMDQVDDDGDEAQPEPEEATKKRKVCFTVNLCGASASEH